MKKIILSVFLTGCCLHAAAGDDFGIWTNIAAEKKINKAWSVEAGIDFRSEQKLQSVTRWGVSRGADYKPWSFLKLSGGYAFLYDRSLQETKTNITGSGRENGYNVDHGFWRSKHRAYFDATGKVKAGRFTLSLRERYQYTHYMSTTCTRDRYRDNPQGGYNGPIYEWNGEQFVNFEQTERNKPSKNRHYLRSRLQVAYNIRHCPLEPYVSYEFSNNLGDGLHLDKTRLSFGMEWKINKKHGLSLAYLYQDGADDDGDNDIHVIDIGYKFKF